MENIGRVHGKIAVVTGGATGIGEACARLLAHEGALVAVTDIDVEKGQEVAESIAVLGGVASFFKLDVSNEVEVEQTMEAIDKKFGSINVLVNNAGISGVNKPTHEITSDEWDYLMSINVKGVFFCTKHVLPQMISIGGGSVINMSSIYGLVGAADIPAYHASKGAVRLMTKTDALFYATQGVRFNSIHPGFIGTPMVEDFMAGQKDPDAAKQALISMHPLGRLGEPIDVAFGVLFLASDESKFMTGSELVIDGGYTAQ